MDEELKNTDKAEEQKPQVFLKCLTFNDKTQLTLKHNSIIVFTGANNSGKSQILKDAENCLNSSDSQRTLIIRVRHTSNMLPP